MVSLMVIAFVVGYVCIAVEHDIGINKAATAILLGMTLWILYMFSGSGVIIGENLENFEHFLAENPEFSALSRAKQAVKFVANYQIVDYLGDYTQIILYLMGAMTIVELIDVHGGFSVITDRITTSNKRRLLWILAFMTFFMSAVLDNLTTAIVMTMLLRKLVGDKRERWLFASIIIIAANSGGAWTPTGDVTTIMLWIAENVTTAPLLRDLFLPALASMLVPLAIVSKMLDSGAAQKPEPAAKKSPREPMSLRERTAILVVGISSFVCVPIFKALTGLPPFAGVLLALGLIWILVEIIYNGKKNIAPAEQLRIQNIIGRIDITTILFFIGILMAVAALQSAGVLKTVSEFLDKNVSNAYIINTIIGMLSAIVDNVPLVAGAMGAYSIPAADALANAKNAAYLANFAQDGIFWQTLAYCAGVGGSMLIIGSAAGVIVMGLEKITFMWYAKNISFLAFLGYISGILVYAAQNAIFG